MAQEQRQQTLHLVALSEIDHRRSEAQSLIDSVPRVLASRHRESSGAETGLAAAREKLKGFQARLKSLELDLAAREEELQKSRGNLLTAKTNQEYTALMEEISRKQENKSEAESAVLEQFDVIKQGEQMVVEAQGRLAEAAEEYQAFEERARGQLADHQKDLGELDVRRNEIRTQLEPEILKIYDRAYGAHGSGVAPAEGNICQGCFSTLTPNDRARMISGRELMICRSCQRILYLPEAVQASPP